MCLEVSAKDARRAKHEGFHKAIITLIKKVLQAFQTVKSIDCVVFIGAEYPRNLCDLSSESYPVLQVTLGKLNPRLLVEKVKECIFRVLEFCW